MKIKILIVLIFIPHLIFAQRFWVNPAMGFIPSVNDARARALGRTEIISATGPNAIFTNPANLGFLNYPCMNFSGRGFSGKIKDDYPKTIQSGDVSENYPLNLKISQFSLALPVNLWSTGSKASIACGYNTFLDWEMNYHNEYKYTDYRPSGKSNHNIDGGISTISAALAVQMLDRLAFGIAFHKSSESKLEIVSEYTLYRESDSVITTDTLITDYKTSNSFAVLGAAVRLPGNINAGLVFRPAFTIQLEGGTTDGYVYGPEYLSLRRIKMGAMYGIGLSKTYPKQIVIAAEYQNRPYSDLRFLDLTKIIGEINNGHCFRCGLEFQSKIPVRFGYFYEAIPVGDDQSFQERPKSVSGITGGLGVATRYFYFDIFGEYASWEFNFYAGDSEILHKWHESLTSFGATMTVQIPWK